MWRINERTYPRSEGRKAKFIPAHKLNVTRERARRRSARARAHTHQHIVDPLPVPDLTSRAHSFTNLPHFAPRQT